MCHRIAWSIAQKAARRKVPDEAENGGGGGCLVSEKREGGDGGGKSPWELIGTLGNRREPKIEASGSQSGVWGVGCDQATCILGCLCCVVFCVKCMWHVKCCLHCCVLCVVYVVLCVVDCCCML